LTSVVRIERHEEIEAKLDQMEELYNRQIADLAERDRLAREP
jgi:hypothetical protein